MNTTSSPERPTFDQRGDAPDPVRVQSAMEGFLAEFGPKTATWMNACVRCGLCAQACHFHLQTGEAKYTPIAKIKPFEDAYHRRAGPFAPIARLFGLSPRLTIEELQTWEELIYDSCTLCGRCTQACPMGIDIAELVKEARHGMYHAGLLPDRLAEITSHAEARHSPFGSPEDFRAAIARIEAEFDIHLPLDKTRASLLLTLAPGDLEEHHGSVVAMARILEKLGIDWTFSSEAFEATNFGFLSGNRELQGASTVRLFEMAREIGADTILLPECGHAWSAARWEASHWLGQAVTDIRVRHIVEFVGEAVEGGSLRLSKLEDARTVTFHDPCQQIRRGGLERWPRVILAALGVELRELEDHGTEAFCCGGGGGVLANTRAEPLRLQAFDLKRQQVEDTGAGHFMTSCGQCRLQFDKSAAATGWDRRVESLIELVGAQIAGD